MFDPFKGKTLQNSKKKQKTQQQCSVWGTNGKNRYKLNLGKKKANYISTSLTLPLNDNV